MNYEKIMDTAKVMIRYLANTILLISIIVFVWSLKNQGIAIYNDQLLWTQLNSMWLVVVMLIMVEKFYIEEAKEDHRNRKRK